MPKAFVVGNWKMNTTTDEAGTLASEMITPFASLDGIEKIVIPPFVSLERVYNILKDTGISVGAQNMHFEANGAHTGEVSATMLRKFCKYVLLGHSERRQQFGETNEVINKKMHAAIETGLCPILCVGETLEQRECGDTQNIITQQLEKCFAGLPHIDNIVIAYEPVWAIGTGTSATPETVVEVVATTILPALQALFGQRGSKQIPILYGGSVTPSNVGQFVQCENIHGTLVGGASLHPDQFIEIAQITKTVKST